MNERPCHDWIQLRAGTPFGMEVQVISSVDRAAAQGALSTVLGALTDVAQ